MEQFFHFIEGNPLESQASQELRPSFLLTLKEANLHGGDLCQEVTKLPQLNKAGIRIILEVALCQRAKAH
jgi:hypothetical protein